MSHKLTIIDNASSDNNKIQFLLACRLIQFFCRLKNFESRDLFYIYFDTAHNKKNYHKPFKESLTLPK